ncbi:hypothetical protein VE02_03291 [Pseudogymnoascus sp. 03VT05]|nr:hypothetical protein VE02_03291 [Pseudogymnoascus sp. 03VT05]
MEPAKTIEEPAAARPPPSLELQPHVELSDAAQAKKILIAEDNVVNQRLLLRILSCFGLTSVDIAVNGKEGVDMVKAAPSAYSLILMDTSMPIMSGLEATKLIREMGIDVPIIALTAHAMKGDRELFLTRGFNGYLSKPMRKPDVGVVLLKWLDGES